MDVILTVPEIVELFIQPVRTKRDGGYQSLLVGLQQRINQATGQITLNRRDLERIPRYAFDYGVGGWENRLLAIFGRALGSRLGRTSP
jgi:hypothetical protein